MPSSARSSPSRSASAAPADATARATGAGAPSANADAPGGRDDALAGASFVFAALAAPLDRAPELLHGDPLDDLDRPLDGPHHRDLDRRHRIDGGNLHIVAVSGDLEDDAVVGGACHTLSLFARTSACRCDPSRLFT